MGCSSFREQSMVSCCVCVVLYCIYTSDCWMFDGETVLLIIAWTFFSFLRRVTQVFPLPASFQSWTGGNVESFLMYVNYSLHDANSNEMTWSEICLWKNQTGPIRVWTQCLFLLSAANHLPRLLCTFASRVSPAVGCCLGKEKKNQVSKATRSLSLHPGAAGWLTGSRAKAAPRTRDDDASPRAGDTRRSRCDAPNAIDNVAVI